MLPYHSYNLDTKGPQLNYFPKWGTQYYVALFYLCPGVAFSASPHHCSGADALFSLPFLPCHTAGVTGRCCCLRSPAPSELQQHRCQFSSLPWVPQTWEQGTAARPVSGAVNTVQEMERKHLPVGGTTHIQVNS